jgi:hypothetical protein
MSAVAIAASGPTLAVTGGTIQLIKESWKYFIPIRYRNRLIPGVIAKCYYSLTNIFFLAFGLFYVFARVYLFVECFISFAYSPDIIFQQPR